MSSIANDDYKRQLYLSPVDIDRILSFGADLLSASFNNLEDRVDLYERGAQFVVLFRPYLLSFALFDPLAEILILLRNLSAATNAALNLSPSSAFQALDAFVHEVQDLQAVYEARRRAESASEAASIERPSHPAPVFVYEPAPAVVETNFVSAASPSVDTAELLAPSPVRPPTPFTIFPPSPVVEPSVELTPSSPPLSPLPELDSMLLNLSMSDETDGTPTLFQPVRTGYQLKTPCRLHAQSNVETAGPASANPHAILRPQSPRPHMRHQLPLTRHHDASSTTA
ncbi:hypothetical protein FB45DRAFT_1057153 [Roridomyces roridus]|uniref:Uncharacterized protein n=1 Tax=Roridomyces roridus TaxID=1738132 RepID=A0AAD7C0C8_9AGAR|nr:hypothetical protein FB45DRAFT_1057153 [Roridomyces roridus]